MNYEKKPYITNGTKNHIYRNPYGMRVLMINTHTDSYLMPMRKSITPPLRPRTDINSYNRGGFPVKIDFRVIHK